MFQSILIVLASAAITIGSWIHVPGGQWDPSAEDLRPAKAQLHEYMIKEAKR